MLIRLINNKLTEYPDELGALALANPWHGNVPDFTLEEVNLLLNIELTSLFEENLTLEDNIEKARKHCVQWGMPSAANMEKASEKVRLYNETIAQKDIGYSDRDFLLDAYGIHDGRARPPERS